MLQPIKKNAGGWVLAGLLVFAASLTGCQRNGFANEYAGAIAQAHGQAQWLAYDVVQADLKVTFMGKTMFQGRLFCETRGGRVRLEMQDDTIVLFDGKRTWLSPADSTLKRARFHALTWSYLLAAPMKLSDPGAHLEDLGPMKLQNKTHHAGRLTFEKGIGDTSEDWYILYADPKTYRLNAMAYIITYDQTVDEAEKHAHAITYKKFVNIDGITLAKHWQFWNWHAGQGLTGKAIGHAELSDIRFGNVNDDAFQKPANARLLELPLR